MSLLATGVQIQTSLALFQRIFEYLDLPVDITERERPVRLDRIKGEVRFEDVEFRYDDKGGPVLDGVDITVPAGGSARRRRPDRRRQVHARLPGAPSVRRHRRPCHAGRRRRTRPRLRHPRACGRRRLPGDVPLPRLGRRQPALRQAGRHRRGAARGGQGGPDPRPHSRPARGLPTRSSANAATASPAARSSGSR
ncbi:hypothetical protein LT493_01745 [Streptomyces tricolor]|nr:hypothetical protein [Streptomyces tricolor]